MTITQRKQELYDATTRARKHFHAVQRKVRERVKKQYPDLPWYDQMNIEEQDTELQEANGRLLGLCDACAIMGIECGE